MTLRFAALGSGSRGNALLVELGNTLLMVDCGLSLKAVEERMSRLERKPPDVSAILVTHEHADHIQGVARFANRWGTRVFMTPGTASAPAAKGISRLRTVNCHRAFEIESISVQPFPVPHDAREPCQFAFSGAGRRLGMLTDTGHVTSHISETLSRCDALAIESNHDVEMLRTGPYPAPVKQRVASSVGHLNNLQAADLLERIAHDELQWVVALHISEQNNSRDEVRAALSDAISDPEDRLHLAEQNAPTDWFEIV
ncbi:MAG TPA: MBL fold metallo-hydrolase [Gammaproteobacteria bacterium]